MEKLNVMTLQICLILIVLPVYVLSVSMKEFEMSMNSIRDACAPQFKLNKDQLAKLRNGIFDDDSKDIKCYTKCVAQMAGTLNKKGEISFQKSMAQIDMLLPDELKETSRQTLNDCIGVQDSYKNGCDKTFYASQCAAAKNDKFKFP